MIDPDVERRGREYAALNGINLDLAIPLGSGTDGQVWESDRRTAVKALRRERNYSLELECYERFIRADVRELKGFAIPRIIGANDELMVIEMSIVTPPFFIDFAKVYLDFPPDYSPEVLADWEEQCVELFEDRWPQAKALLRALEAYGIYYTDPKPGNIMFGDTPHV